VVMWRLTRAAAFTHARRVAHPPAQPRGGCALALRKIVFAHRAPTDCVSVCARLRLVQKACVCETRRARWSLIRAVWGGLGVRGGV